MHCSLHSLVCLVLAPAVGFEPTTWRLTAARSTTELRRNDRGFCRERNSSREGRRLPRGMNPLVEVVAQLAGSRWVAEFAERLRLNLANALAGHIELRTHLFQGSLTTILQAEAEPQHALLPLTE